MSWGHAPFVLLMLLAALLLSAGLEDVRRREIADYKNAAIALLALPWWWANHLAFWPDIAVQLGVATIVFALFAGAFAMNWMGGGDVKMIGALALWLPLGRLTEMLAVMSIAGGAVTLAMVIEAHWPQRRADGARDEGRATTPPVEVPYGVAIAVAGLLSLPSTGF